MRQKLLGQEHPDVATSINNLAFLYNRQGRNEEADPLYLQALVLKKKLLGNEHPDVANSFWCLSYFYNQQGDKPKAIDYIREALQIAEAKLGQEHPSTQRMRDHLSRIQDN